MRTCLSACFLALFCAASLAEQSSTSGQSRQDGVDQREDHVMGFSHDLITHHFQLLKDGGEIAVTANDPKDTAGVEQIPCSCGQFNHTTFNPASPRIRPASRSALAVV